MVKHLQNTLTVCSLSRAYSVPLGLKATWSAVDFSLVVWTHLPFTRFHSLRSSCLDVDRHNRPLLCIVTLVTSFLQSDNHAHAALQFLLKLIYTHKSLTCIFTLVSMPPMSAFTFSVSSRTVANWIHKGNWWCWSYKSKAHKDTICYNWTISHEQKISHRISIILSWSVQLNLNSIGQETTNQCRLWLIPFIAGKVCIFGRDLHWFVTWSMRLKMLPNVLQMNTQFESMIEVSPDKNVK